MKTFFLMAWFFPLLAFCIAARMELRSAGPLKRKLRHLIPILLGIATLAFSIHPGRLVTLTPGSSVQLSRAMTMFSALISSSAVFIKYSRSSTGVWVALGGLVLTAVWMVNIVRA